MTSKFCVVGSPVQHSLSPIIHKAAYSHLGLDFSYERHDVPAGALLQFLDASDYSGVSVTMPLKFEAFGLSNPTSEAAKQTKVSNTLIKTDQGWDSENTDVFGLMTCFDSLMSVSQAVVLGSGATARSALFAISKTFPDAEIVAMARNPASSKDLAELCQSIALNAVFQNPEAIPLLSADLVVSTVPALGFESLWLEVSNSMQEPTGVLIDVAYTPWPSIAAESWGAKSISGLEMLIWQATEQVRLFARAQGESVEINSAELYGVMARAVKNQTAL